MAKKQKIEPFLSEKEIQVFRSRMQRTFELGEKYGAKFTNPGNTANYNTLDVISAYYTDRLDKDSKRLVFLTWVLTILTLVLAALTAVLVFDTMRGNA